MKLDSFFKYRNYVLDNSTTITTEKLERFMAEAMKSEEVKDYLRGKYGSLIGYSDRKEKMIEKLIAKED